VQIVRQFHHIVEAAQVLIAANVEDADKPRMTARDRLELHDSLELPVEGPVAVESFPGDDFDGPVRAGDVAAEPHFAVSAAADAADQFVIRQPPELNQVFGSGHDQSSSSRSLRL
jgi:hypothetical protein